MESVQSNVTGLQFTESEHRQGTYSWSKYSTQLCFRASVYCHHIELESISNFLDLIKRNQTHLRFVVCYWYIFYLDWHLKKRNKVSAVRNNT